MKSKFHLAHLEKDFGIRYGSFSFRGKQTFTSQRAKVSTELNYLYDIKKFDQSKIAYPGDFLLAYKKLDVEKFINKESEYYVNIVNQLSVYSRKGPGEYKIFKPILGIYKKHRVFNKKEKAFKIKKKFYPISMFPEIIDTRRSYITKLLVELASDAKYNALINPYKWQSFLAKDLITDTKDAISKKDELTSLGLNEIDIIPSVLLSSKSNSEFEKGVKYVYKNHQEFSSMDYSYSSRVRNKYNYDSVRNLNKKNENVMNILSDIFNRKMPEKSFNLSPYHYYQVYNFDVIAKGMPSSFLAEDQDSVHDKDKDEIRFFDKKPLSIIEAVPRVVLSPDFKTTFPLLAHKDYAEVRDILKRAQKAEVLDTMSKAMEFHDSYDELSKSQDYVANDSFRDYLKEKKELSKAFVKHNHFQRSLSDLGIG